MRIKRLEICGFKSFMDRTVFTFGEGITGVVGPNGCGKSNVVDAIRWAMGEQSAKHLRGRSMEDVIFAGSESQPPLGMAEVTLTFFNDHPALLPAQYQGFDEISVTRRLFRNGDSEYAVNRTPCRLLDITELFLGTGVGTKAYSIIEQGRIGVIVSSKPEERRSLIEEAAGITRYKSRRKAAERKLELTDQNLLRVSDVASELGRRLDSLNRQAKKAEKYKQLKGAIREIDLHVAALRFLELTVTGRAAREAVEQLASEEREVTTRTVEAEAATERLREQLAQEEQALAAQTEEVHRLDRELQVGRANLESWRREGEQAERRIAETRLELETIDASRALQTAEREALTAQKSSLAGGATGNEAQFVHVRTEVDRWTAEEKGLTQSLEKLRALLMGTHGRLAGGRSTLESLARQQAELTQRGETLQGEGGQLDEQVETLSRKHEEARGSLARLLETHQGLETRRTEAEAALKTLSERLTHEEKALHEQRNRLSERRSRHTSLREIERNYEGHARGVRAVMAHIEPEAKAHGVLGLVSDLLKVPARFEAAIEAALGERLETVVVEKPKNAFTLASWLREAREGRGAFLPLASKTSGPRAKGSELPPSPGLFGTALSLVQYRDDVAPTLEALLGSVGVVADLETALALGKAHPEMTWVTLDGELLEPTGRLVGGALEGAGVGALHKKRELTELADEVTRLESDFREGQERLTALSEERTKQQAALEQLGRELQAQTIARVEQEKDLQRLDDDLKGAHARREKLATERELVARSMAQVGDGHEKTRAEITQAEVDKTAHETTIREQTEALATARSRLAELVTQRTEIQVKVAAEVERRESVDKGLERTAATLVELAERSERLEKSIEEAQARQASLQTQSETAQSAQSERVTTFDTLKSLQQEAKAAFDRQATHLRENEATSRAARKRLDELQSGLSHFSLKEREYAIELNHLLTNTQEKHGVEIGHELIRFHSLPPPTPQQKKERDELRTQIERMGEINLTAIEEQAELAERHAFMVGQKTDLEKSIGQLKRAIGRVNKTSRERFIETFDAVNERFQQIFPRLFSGGRASLVLVDNDEGSEPGIEIMAQPPGKKLQSVNLLSGGEKALTAVALIFAIFLIKPTPFCLLDEVDAPLDEANVGRYNDLVREMSQLSQFILITHNKKTMQIADVMYGVTMEEPGVSKIVTVKLDTPEEPPPATPPDRD